MHCISLPSCYSCSSWTLFWEISISEDILWQFKILFHHLSANTTLTSSYPGWIKSPHVVTLGILKLWGGGYSRVNFVYPKSEVFRKGGYSGVNFGHPKSEVFRKGGYSGVNFGHPKSEVFQKGGYSGVNFGHPKSEVFRNGGVFRSKLWSSQI